MVLHRRCEAKGRGSSQRLGPRERRPSSGRRRDRRTSQRGQERAFQPPDRPRLAIVEDTAGVTRDRLYAVCEWRGRTFGLVDTAGIDPEADRSTAMRCGGRAPPSRGRRQRKPTSSCSWSTRWPDVIRSTMRSHAILRRGRRHVVLAANKSESPAAAASMYSEFARLGFGEPVAVSALHGEGSGDLLDSVVDALPERPDATGGDELALAIIGRPNVGKSSLLNSCSAKSARSSATFPGTTRDAIDTLLTGRDRTIRLIDTAGVRKQPKVHGAIEYYSALTFAQSHRTMRHRVAGIRRDGRRNGARPAPRRHRDRRAQRPDLVGNKWDLVREQGEFSQGELANVIHDLLPFAKFAPVKFLSAKTHRRLGSLMPVVDHVAENLQRRIPTAALERGNPRGSPRASRRRAPGGTRSQSFLRVPAGRQSAALRLSSATILKRCRPTTSGF